MLPLLHPSSSTTAGYLHLSTSTSLQYAVILDNSLVVRKKETKEKIEKIEVLDQTHKMTCKSANRKKREVKDQMTNGPVNTHLISWPSKSQNIQNLENIW